MIELTKYFVRFQENEKEFPDALSAIAEAEKLTAESEKTVDDNKLDVDDNPFNTLFKTLATSARAYKRVTTPSGLVKQEDIITRENPEPQYDGLTVTISDSARNKPIVAEIYKKDKMVYTKGCMICSVCPCGVVPLALEIAICPDGGILHRGWNWNGNANGYLHTLDNANEVNVTPEMIDTVNGLFSGRILFDGIKIAVGKSVQDICPINLEREEKLIGKKIYLA